MFRNSTYHMSITLVRIRLLGEMNQKKKKKNTAKKEKELTGALVDS